MSFEAIVTIVMGVLGAGLGITLGLMRLLYNSLTSRMDRRDEEVNLRLRSLGHEDRDIRNQLQGINRLFWEHLRNKGN